MSTRNRDTVFFGHPLGLATCFFTEMWERFSFYGIRALLIVYMTTPIEAGGLGMSVTGGGLVMALYLSANYLLSLPGGWIADRFLGQRKAVMYGGAGIIIGNALLALPMRDMFLPGLAVIALGTGLLKPNISTIVGKLYSADDIRRDSGYTIYYMGINIGAWIAPLACGFLAQSESFRSFLAGAGIDPRWCWHFGFAAGSVGMLLGVIQYSFTQGWLGKAGAEPHQAASPAEAAGDRRTLTIILATLGGVILLFVVGKLVDLQVEADTITNVFGLCLVIGSIVLFVGLFRSARDAGERTRVIAMIPLFLGSIAFFGVFEQASTTLSVFAEKLTERELLGLSIPSSYYQSVNSVFIILLAPVFAWIWLRMARARREPSSVLKFSIGMAFAALSFIVMLPTLSTVTKGGQVTGWYLIALYFLSTCSELCISPVGLSSMSKLAPDRLAGMVMGVWFLGASNGNYLAGRSAGFAETRGFDFLFYFLIGASLVVSLALLVVAPIIKRMMRDEETPPVTQTSAEPELPSARVINDKLGDKS